MTTSTITRRKWATVVSAVSAEELKLSPEHADAQLPLITRTGFEQRHIVTSQIASL